LPVGAKSAKLKRMEIRPLDENNAARYREVRLKALQEEPLAFGKAPDEFEAISVEAMAARLREMAPDFTLGAFEGADLIGTATFMREKGQRAKHKGRIYGVYVSASERGKGVGKKLIAALLKKAGEDPSLEQILLAVATGQEPACHLYRTFGFKTFGTEPRALKVGSEYVDEEHMILRLR
jgi:ribosomal protein S18 acetylase RimI-like enzyme